jgi:hypothetical protein
MQADEAGSAGHESGTGVSHLSVSLVLCQRR